MDPKYWVLLFNRTCSPPNLKKIPKYSLSFPFSTLTLYFFPFVNYLLFDLLVGNCGTARIKKILCRMQLHHPVSGRRHPRTQGRNCQVHMYLILGRVNWLYLMVQWIIPKKHVSLCNKSRHCAYIIYSVKTWYIICSTPRISRENSLSTMNFQYFFP